MFNASGPNVAQALGYKREGPANKREDLILRSKAQVLGAIAH